MNDEKPPTFSDLSFVNLLMLKFLAVIPFDGHSFYFIGTRFIVALQYVLIPIYTTIFIEYGIRKFGEAIYEIDYICETVVVLGLCLRYFILFRRRDQLVTMVQFCENIWEDLTVSEKLITFGFVKKIHRVVYFFFGTCVLSNVFFLIATQLVQPSRTFGNETIRRTLPTKFYVDVQESPWYEMTCTLQVVLIFNGGLICSAVDTIAPFLIMISCGCLKSLRFRLMAVFEQQHSTERGLGLMDNREFKANLVACVHFHDRILKFCREIENLASGIFMTQVLTATYNLSLSGFKLLSNDPDRLKFTPVVSLFVIQLFTCQWPADVLLTESEAVSKALYFIPVSSDRESINKLIHFMIMRSQKPIQMRAGRIVKLSLECFGSMMTRAASFFTVLRSLNI